MTVINSSKRHMCHDPSVSAEKGMTDGMTHYTSMCHPSCDVSSEKPLDHAEDDTYDTSDPKTGVTPEKEQRMAQKFAGFKARKYFFKDGENSRWVIQLMMGTKHVGFMEYAGARHFVDRIHDICDEHEYGGQTNEAR